MTDFQFRLWTYLIAYVDDYGRGSADPELIKGLVFPRRKRVTEKDIGEALAGLAGMGCINLYEVDGESYLYFPKWSEHQRIQTKKSKFPEPTIDKCGPPQSTVKHGDPPLESNPNTNTIPPLPPQGEAPTAQGVGDGAQGAGKANPPEDKTDYARVIALFSEICKTLPTPPEQISDKRKKKIKAAGKLLTLYASTFTELFQIVDTDPHWSGRSGAWDRCDLNWVLSNVEKIMEKRNKKPAQTQPEPRPLGAEVRRVDDGYG